MSKTDKLHLLSCALGICVPSNLKFISLFNFSCHIRNNKKKNSNISVENLTTISVYVQLMLNNMLIVDYPNVRAVK